MRKLTLLMHVSLDGFVAGPGGEMDWIHVDPEIFEYTGALTDEADTAVYGRVTYEMMQSYWPDAGTEPNASEHDKQHSHWYNTVEKIVVSRSMAGTTLPHTQVISDNLAPRIKGLKHQEGRNMLMLGSPSVVHSFMELGLIDEFYLFINPVLLGTGIPLFRNVQERLALNLLSSRSFGEGGVMLLHYGLVTATMV
jgi:dihydrofolate reductase